MTREQRPNFEDVVQWTPEQQALSPAGGKISKLNDANVEGNRPELLDDDGRAIFG